MSGEVRVIKFNEDLFKIPSGTQRKKPDKPIKVKAAKKVSDKTIRNRVLNEIRKNQEKQYQALMSEPAITDGSSSNEFNKDFEDSMKFMDEVVNKYKAEVKHNETLRAIRQPVYEEPIQNIIPARESNLIPVVLENVPLVGGSVSIKPAPPVPYGCMKVGGTLPTYRAYHNTLKAPAAHAQAPVVTQPIKEVPQQNNLVESSPSEPIPEKPVIAERILSPTEIAMQERAKPKPMKPLHKKVKKLLRRTYRVGKDKVRPKVGVVLPNKTIRTNITTKAYMLKQTPIEEIRKTLVKKGFIKHGSSAPNDVLRKIYESVQMIGGEVSNYNADNLLYNFFTNKE